MSDFNYDNYSSDVQLGDDVLERAKAKLAKCKPAIEGKGGREETRRAARAVLNAGLSAADALQLLLKDYNPRCVPPWSDKELGDLVRDVAKGKRKPGSKPVLVAPDVLHKAYTALLACYSLSASDKESILKRGFTTDEIERLGYSTLTASIDKRKLATKTMEVAVGAADLAKIPGVEAIVQKRGIAIAPSAA
ncbi:MAG: hypothetical protein ACHREM_18935 [Polyangiales bacterium]